MTETESTVNVSERELALAAAYKELWARCDRLESDLKAAHAAATVAQDGLKELRGCLSTLEAQIERHGDAVAHAAAAAEHAEFKAMLAEVSATIDLDNK